MSKGGDCGVDRAKTRPMHPQNPGHCGLNCVKPRTVYINFFIRLGFFIGFIPYPFDLALNLLGARLFYSLNLDGIASSRTQFGIDLCIARIVWLFDFIADAMVGRERRTFRSRASDSETPTTVKETTFSLSLTDTQSLYLCLNYPLENSSSPRC
jgi:hypothetical protein